MNVRHAPGVEGSAGFSGFATCGSVWTCPCCAPKIANERSQNLEAGFAEWQRRGNYLGFLTLTMRHTRGDALAALWDAVVHGWRSAISGRGKADLDVTGCAGWVRVTEVTHTRNGWHVHVHAVLFLEHGVTDDAGQALAGRMHARWTRGLARHGFTSVAKSFDGESVGVDFKMVKPGESTAGRWDLGLARYLTKNVYTPDAAATRGLSLEVARGDLKRGKGSGSVTPWQLLDHANLGEADAFALWWEWEEASAGRRQFGWSRGIRDDLGLDDERSDDDIAADETGGEDVLSLPAETVRALVRETIAHRHTNVTRPALSAVLATLDRYGVDGLRRYLDLNGLAYGPPVVAQHDAVADAGSPARMARLTSA